MRPWYRLHLSTWIGVAMVALTLAAIVWPTRLPASHNRDVHELHGWPWLFADCHWFDDDSDGHVWDNGHELPFLTPDAWRMKGERHWNYSALLADLAVAVGILLLTAGGVEFRRRRRGRVWQTSLRELLAATLLVALGMYWYMWHRNLYAAEQPLRIWLELSGGRNPAYRWGAHGPDWLINLVSPSNVPFCEHVDELKITDQFWPVYREAFGPLTRRLAYLKNLDLSVESDAFELLGDWSSVEHLQLRRSAETSAADLITPYLTRAAQMPRLTELSLTGVPLNDRALDGMARLTRLETVHVMYDRAPAGMPDFRILQNLPRLKTVEVIGCNEDQVTAIRQALPQATIVGRKWVRYGQFRFAE